MLRRAVHNNCRRLQKRDEFQTELDAISGSGERLETLKKELEETKYDIMMNVSINYALKNMYLEIN